MEANKEPLELFLACATQWKRDLLGEALGLDYTAMYAVAESLEMKVDHVMLRKIQILEQDVISPEPESGHAPAGKPCRHPQACAMCQKDCSERMNAQR